jgi:hypothetical protein
MRSKSETRKSFISGEIISNRLIWRPWHGRGREFGSHQVRDGFLPSLVVCGRTAGRYMMVLGDPQLPL